MTTSSMMMYAERCRRTSIASVVASFLLVVLLATGCSVFGSDDDAASGLTLTRDRASYRSGEAVTLRLVNETDATVRYNLCRSELQVLADDGRWSALEVAPACILILQTLDPGQHATYAYPLPDRLNDASPYRLQTTVRLVGANGEERSRTLHTRSFTVEPSTESRR